MYVIMATLRSWQQVFCRTAIASAATTSVSLHKVTLRTAFGSVFSAFIFYENRGICLVCIIRKQIGEIRYLVFYDTLKYGSSRGWD